MAVVRQRKEEYKSIWKFDNNKEKFNLHISISKFTNHQINKMARFRGPKSKIARTFGEPILGYSKALEKKAYPPGMHGQTRKRKQSSDYSVQLKEKQKAKHTYGLLERQFAKLFKEANRKKGITGENMLQLLEARLDNTVYRLGIAPTRRAARQFVSHQHITVNSEIVSVPSYNLKVGDIVGVREKSKSMEAIQNSLSAKSQEYNWLEWDDKEMKGKLIAFPERNQIPENIKEQLIVELYSK